MSDMTCNLTGCWASSVGLREASTPPWGAGQNGSDGLAKAGRRVRSGGLDSDYLGPHKRRGKHCRLPTVGTSYGEDLLQSCGYIGSTCAAHLILAFIYH